MKTISFDSAHTLLLKDLRCCAMCRTTLSS